MGKRQRQTEFIGLSDEQVARLARDPNAPTAQRRKAQAEEKFRRRRSRRKDR